MTRHAAIRRAPARATRAWPADLRWGLGWGAWTAAFFTVPAVVALAEPGSADAFARHHTTFPAYVGYLWATGAGAGLGAAVLRPWLARAWAAAVLGWLVGALMIVGVYVARGRSVGEAAYALRWIAPVGAPWGLLWWWRTRTRAAARRADV